MLVVFLSPCVGYCVVPRFERDMSWAGSAHVNDSCTENVVMLVKLIRYVFWSRLTACLLCVSCYHDKNSSITNWFCQWPSDKLSTYYNLSMHNRQNDKRETECSLCSRAAGVLHVVSYMCSKSWGWCTVTVVHCTVTVLWCSDCGALHIDCAVMYSDCGALHSDCAVMYSYSVVARWLLCCTMTVSYYTVTVWLCCVAVVQMGEEYCHAGDYTKALA